MFTVIFAIAADLTFVHVTAPLEQADAAAREQLSKSKSREDRIVADVATLVAITQGHQTNLLKTKTRRKA